MSPDRITVVVLSFVVALLAGVVAVNLKKRVSTYREHFVAVAEALRDWGFDLFPSLFIKLGTGQPVQAMKLVWDEIRIVSRGDVKSAVKTEVSRMVDRLVSTAEGNALIDAARAKLPAAKSPASAVASG